MTVLSQVHPLVAGRWHSVYQAYLRYLSCVSQTNLYYAWFAPVCFFANAAFDYGCVWSNPYTCQAGPSWLDTFGAVPYLANCDGQHPDTWICSRIGQAIPICRRQQTCQYLSTGCGLSTSSCQEAFPPVLLSHTDAVMCRQKHNYCCMQALARASHPGIVCLASSPDSSVQANRRSSSAADSRLGAAAVGTLSLSVVHGRQRSFLSCWLFELRWHSTVNSVYHPPFRF